MTRDGPSAGSDQREIPTAGVLDELALAMPMSPLLDRRTTLKDALSMLLDADVQAGIVVDRNVARLAAS